MKLAEAGSKESKGLFGGKGGQGDGQAAAETERTKRKAATAPAEEKALATREASTSNWLVIADPAVREVLEDNLTGRTMQFDRIRIPSGGGLAFEVPDDEDCKLAQELAGVVVHHHAVNARWAGRFTGQNNPPVCSALDGVTGVGDPGGDCRKCRFNQWGSAVNQDGSPGKGKACKNLHRIYVLPQGEVFPCLVALPPTSLTNWDNYMARLVSKRRKSFWMVATRIKLEKAVNKQGIPFSKCTFSRVDDLDPQEALQLRAFTKDKLIPAMQRVEVASDDYHVGDDDEATAGASAAAAEDDGQPF